jgi:alginate O-acetyltransferase complex protein AlgI
MISEITEITDNTGWMAMWGLSAAMFFVAKLLIARPLQDRAAFIALWPGFDLRAWHRTTTHAPNLIPRGLANLLGGATLTWLIARHAPTTFIATWLCMIGFVVALHSGVFTLLAEFWRRRGRDVSPLMNCPLGAASVTEFWGKRWNLGFRDLAHTLLFKPLHRRFGKVIAISTVFLVSGLAHELVITVPARGGYGGPTIYFLLQALCMGMERGCPFKKHGVVWRIRALIFLAVPLPLLFPTVFVERVMRPFFTFLHALP